MDPTTLAFDAATALTAALTLLFSRLDTRRILRAERHSYRTALEQLSYAVHIWIIDAELTDRDIQEWASGTLNEADEPSFVYRWESEIHHQIETSAQAFAILHGDFDWDEKLRIERERFGESADYQWWHSRHRGWTSLRHLLKIYGPETLTVLEKGFGQRRILLDEIAAELPALKARGSADMQDFAAQLGRATRELVSAEVMLDEYIRTHFLPIA